MTRCETKDVFLSFALSEKDKKIYQNTLIPDSFKTNDPFLKKPKSHMDRSQDAAFSLQLMPKEKLRNLHDFQVGNHVIKIGPTPAGNDSDYSYMSRVCLIKEMKGKTVVIKELMGNERGKFYKINWLSVYPIHDRFLENWGSVNDLSEPYLTEVLSLLSPK